MCLCDIHDFGPAEAFSQGNGNLRAFCNTWIYELVVDLELECHINQVRFLVMAFVGY